MKTRVAMLFGGKSVEHEVSVISGIQAYLSMDTDKYEVIPVYMTKKNEMYIGEEIGKMDSYKDIPKLLSGSRRVIMINEDGKVKLTPFPLKKFGKNQDRDRCGLSGGAWNQCGGRRIAGLFKDHRRAFCGL